MGINQLLLPGCSSKEQGKALGTGISGFEDAADGSRLGQDFVPGNVWIPGKSRPWSLREQRAEFHWELKRKNSLCALLLPQHQPSNKPRDKFHSSGTFLGFSSPGETPKPEDSMVTLLQPRNFPPGVCPLEFCLLIPRVPFKSVIFPSIKPICHGIKNESLKEAAPVSQGLLGGLFHTSFLHIL